MHSTSSYLVAVAFLDDEPRCARDRAVVKRPGGLLERRDAFDFERFIASPRGAAGRHPADPGARRCDCAGLAVTTPKYGRICTDCRYLYVASPPDPLGAGSRAGYRPQALINGRNLMHDDSDSAARQSPYEFRIRNQMPVLKSVAQ